MHTARQSDGGGEKREAEGHRLDFLGFEEDGLRELLEELLV
jgi:hypothetical protein